MNITIIGTSWPYRGGLATFNDRLAQQFIKEGHSVKTITFTLQYPGFLFPGKTQFADSPAPEGLEISREINSCNPLNWIKVGNRIRKQRPDLVVIAYWMSFMAPCFGTIARCIKRNRHTKCVALVHNMIPHEPNILDKLFPGYFVKAMDGFTALAKSTLEDIKKFDHKGKTKTFAPHPIYDHYGTLLEKGAARKMLGVEEVGRYVLFFGFIREYKGLDLLLEAMADQRLKERDVRLIVAGEFYSDPKPYTDLIERLGIKDRVILRNDYIPDNEVNRYFGAGDIVAQTYRSATQSGVTQIAFHFEKPMIVTNVGGLAEIVPDNKIGFVVDTDPKAIATAIAKFYDEEKEATFVEGVRTEKTKYSWNRMTQAILDTLN